MEPSVIHEEKDFLVLAKPAGLLMHRIERRAASGERGKVSPIHSETTLADWVRDHYPETGKVGDDPAARPGIVHRLDKDTSGILLICRNQKFFEYAKDLFQTRKIKKTYLALVRGHLDRERNIIDKPLGIRPGTTQRSVRSTKMQKDALTEYHVLARAVRRDEEAEDPRFKSSLLEVLPHTGRTHQIRVHLTSIGHPILGDPVYGPKHRPSWITRLMLHSFSLSFQTQKGKDVFFEARPGEEFENILVAAGVSGEYPYIRGE